MRTAFLSDIHSNLEALDAVLVDARDDVSAWVVLGDIVGYNADPAEVIARLMSLPNATLLAGNHDLAATGRFDVSIFNSVAAAAIRWTADTLPADARAVLDGLEPRGRIDIGTIVHGSVVDPAIEYVSNVEVARRSFDAEDFTTCFFGHTHMPTCFVCDDAGRVEGTVLSEGAPVKIEPGARFMLNPGSVGQPRDGDPRASYLVYDDVENTAVVHRVAYDIATTQTKIRDAGLPKVLADRLEIGR
jgi:predicted phosphodiesterase